MIADLWLSIKQLWIQQSLWANLASIFTVIAALYGFVHFMGKGVRALIRFLNRERVKDKAELRKFSEVLARDMYENQQARGGLFIPHI